jgi:hydrogenase maturation protease
MKKSRITKKILLIGIGNDGRSDDAAGWRFVDTWANFTDVFDIEYRYQLQIEDAELVSLYKEVIFVDATEHEWKDGFGFYKCQSNPSSAYTSHELCPETVMWLANTLYQAKPIGYVMAISGTHWDLALGLSKTARANFENAQRFFIDWLREKKGIRIPNSESINPLLFPISRNKKMFPKNR